eukprot:363911-Chlamydomonas_euryale.AAC.6
MQRMMMDDAAPVPPADRGAACGPIDKGGNAGGAEWASRPLDAIQMLFARAGSPASGTHSFGVAEFFAERVALDAAVRLACTVWKGLLNLGTG